MAAAAWALATVTCLVFAYSTSPEKQAYHERPTLVGVAANTVARWERGEMKVQPAMDRLVRLVVGEADRKRATTRKRS